MESTFPKKSVDKAKYVAEEIKRRRKYKSSCANSLYNSEFLHVIYGFSDAIKSGRCGHFLHEMSYDSDCFSYAGMLYLVAKELNLEPKIYDAKGMQELYEYETPNEATRGNHTFITIKLSGKEYLLDPFHSNYGEIKSKEDSHWLIKNKKKYDLISKRRFRCIDELTESEYVEDMNEHRSPKGGKEVLLTSQALDTSSGRVFVEYDPENSLLHSFHRSKRNSTIFPKDIVLPHFTYEIKFPVNNKGQLSKTDASFGFFYEGNNEWNLEDKELVDEMFFPLELLNKYLHNMIEAARFNGINSKRRNLVTGKKIYSFYKKTGFDRAGRVVSENGIDPVEHNDLIEAILEFYTPTELNPIHKTFLDRESIYIAKTIEHESETGEPFIYPKEVRDDFENEFLSRLKERYELSAKCVFDYVKSCGGLLKNKDELNLKIEKLNNRNDEITTFKNALVQDKKDWSYSYDRLIDSSIFSIENPLDTFDQEPSEEEIKIRKMSDLRLAAMFMMYAQPSMELRGFKTGLERILGA